MNVMRSRIMRPLGRIIAVGALVAGTTTNAAADPDWWNDTPKALLEAAVQNHKSIVLYFESEGSADCGQMESETWPALSSSATSKYLWKRCMNGKQEDKVFFDKYEITSVPEIVVLDTERRERGRLRGFIAPDLIVSIIDGLPTYDEGEDVNKTYTYGDGIVFTAQEIKDLGKEFDPAAHAYLLTEDFDSANSINELDRSIFEFYVNPSQTMRLVSDEGYFKSKGLFVTGFDQGMASNEMQPAVAMRVDLSEKLKKVKLVEGIVEVRVRVRVVQLPDDRPSEVIALSVLPLTAKAPHVRDVRDSYRTESQVISRNNSQTVWKDIVIRTTKAVRFGKSSVWLNLWVDGAQMGFMADDLRVRLLSETQVKEGAEIAATADPNEILGDTVEEEATPLFLRLDTDKNGHIERAEFPKRRIEFKEKNEKQNFAEWWKSTDKNGNGTLEPDEFRE